jgi:hypothetical protein
VVDRPLLSPELHLMISITTAERGALRQHSIETRASWLVASTTVGIASVSLGAPISLSLR